MKILVVGDVVGENGVKKIKEVIQQLKQKESELFEREFSLSDRVEERKLASFLKENEGILTITEKNDDYLKRDKTTTKGLKEIDLERRVLVHCTNFFPKDKVILSEVNNDELDNKIIEVDAPNQSLWEYGISGDYPIVLVKIKDLNDFHVVDSMIKAYEYFASKHIKIELVIMTKVDIEDKLESTDKAKYIGKRAGIFVLDNIKREKQKVIESRACFIIDAHKGSVTKQMKELDSDELFKENKKELNDKKEKLFEISNIDRTLRDRCKTGSYKAIRLKKNNMVKDDIINEQDLMFFNGYGGFTKDGMEYWIVQTKKNRLPVAWSNILTNDKFGSVVTDSMRWIYMVCK